MELNRPTLFQDFVLGIAGRVCQSQFFHQPWLGARLIQTIKMFGKSLRRLAPNHLCDGMNEIKVSVVEVHVEPAGKKDGVADLEQSHINIADQLGDDVVTREGACGALGHAVSPKDRTSADAAVCSV